MLTLGAGAEGNLQVCRHEHSGWGAEARSAWNCTATHSVTAPSSTRSPVVEGRLVCGHGANLVACGVAWEDTWRVQLLDVHTLEASSGNVVSAESCPLSVS